MKPFLILNPPFHQKILLIAAIILPFALVLIFFKNWIFLFSDKFLTIVITTSILQLLYNLTQDTFLFFEDKVEIINYYQFWNPKRGAKIDDKNKLVFGYLGTSHVTWIVYVEQSDNHERLVEGNATSCLSTNNIKQVSNLLTTKYGSRFETK